MKKLLSVFLSLVMIFTLSVPAFAADASAAENTQVITISDYVTPEGQAFLDKVESIFPYFTLDENNKLAISLSEEDLTSTYGFTSSDLVQLNDLLAFQSNAVDRGSNIPQTRLHVSDWKIYFDNADVHAFLLAAAQAGPAAIMAALSALGSVYPGVGTVVGAIVGLFGGATIIYWVFQAVALNKGLYIGIDWNGVFPNPAIGLW